MPLSPISPYTEEVRTLYADYTEKIREVAARVRAEVVIPFCDRHGVEFVCGMGEYTFHRDNIGTEEWEVSVAPTIAACWSTNSRPTEHSPEGYEAVFNAINTEVPDNMGYNLFLFMESYDPRRSASSMGRRSR